VIEDMNPGALVDVIEYDGEVEGLPCHVYGGLMTQRNVVYNRAFIGFAYRFIEETTELFKGASTAHLQREKARSWYDPSGGLHGKEQETGGPPEARAAEDQGPVERDPVDRRPGSAAGSDFRGREAAAPRLDDMGRDSLRSHRGT
jgi:hypothetical protein